MLKFEVLPKTFANFRSRGRGVKVWRGQEPSVVMGWERHCRLWSHVSSHPAWILHHLYFSRHVLEGRGTGQNSWDSQQPKKSWHSTSPPTHFSSHIDFTFFSPKVFPTDTPKAQLPSFSFLLESHLRKAFSDHAIHSVAFLGFVFLLGPACELTCCVIICVLFYCLSPQ